MDRELLATTVRAAQGGDTDAFAVLVGEFQPVAAATAFGWLRDSEAARDVCQDTFTDAWRLLSQLDEPHAFPGWFRRIVVKHCDRRTRTSAPTMVVLDDIELAAPDADPAIVAERADESRRLRLAVEALPRDERVVVALTYLAGRTESDVAAWLELPVGTVKTRLHRARARLRREMHEMAEDTMRRLHPEIFDEDLTDVVLFFIALRAGDHEMVGALARRNPALLDAEEAWDTDLSSRGLLPVANRATPLIRAVERGDAGMVDTLLSLGADPNHRCGCAVVEPPLWTAVLTGRFEIACALLDAGADVNAAAFSGQTPVQVAMNRGDEALVALLLSRTGDLLETGIKAIDLFAPIAAGDRVQVVTAPYVGSTVLLAELSYRFLARGLAVRWSGFVPPPLDPADLEGALAESGLAGRVHMALAPVAPRADGVVFVFTSPGHEAENDALLRRLGDAGDRVTTFVVTPFNDGTAVPDELSAPWDARIVFDPRLAVRKVYPCIDGARSASRHRAAGSRHDELASRAAAALQDLDSEPAADVMKLFRQPFFTAQPFHGRSGEYVAAVDTLRAVEAVVGPSM